jgi:hypothetical protein
MFSRGFFYFLNSNPYVITRNSSKSLNMKLNHIIFVLPFTKSKRLN